jgi:hypothetical protein
MAKMFRDVLEERALCSSLSVTAAAEGLAGKLCSITLG